MNDVILEASGLVKSFGGFRAVDGVDLKVERGSVHALIGPNGAGKTTCFNLLTRYIEPTSGRIVFNGKDVTSVSAENVARSGMVRSFQISAVFPNFSVRENVIVALQRPLGISYSFWKSIATLKRLRARADEILETVGLTDVPDVLAADLSYGRKRVLELATTLAAEPEILLLDEPMAGLGREDIGRVTEIIRSLRRTRTILMVEHNLSVVADLSDTITVLTRGRILTQGDYKTVSSNPEVIEAYMGAGHA